MIDAPASLLAIFPEAVIQPTGAPGAYLLEIELDRSLAVTIRGAALTLPAGRYAYAGSARGPGGIAARVARHMSRDKRPHWHIDQLTLATSKISALALPGGSECELVRSLLDRGARVPIPGFGSSDCRTCPAHLLGIRP